MILLLVDDDDDILETMAELLARAFVVRTARSVREAMASLDAGDIDVLVTDFELGCEQRGDWLVEYAAARWPRVRRIVFSSSAVPDGLPAHAVIDKPDLDALIAAILG